MSASERLVTNLLMKHFKENGVRVSIPEILLNKTCDKG